MTKTKVIAAALGLLVLVEGAWAAGRDSADKAKPARVVASDDDGDSTIVLTDSEKEIVRQAREEFASDQAGSPASKRLQDRMQDEMNTSAVMSGAEDDRRAVEALLPRLSPRSLQVVRAVAEKLQKSEKQK